MVTAETAVVMPALVLVLGSCLWALTVVMAELQCIDAARAAARIAARGDGDARARAAALEAAPAGSTVTITRRGGLVRVVVRASGGSGPLGIGMLEVRAGAGAVDEAALRPGWPGAGVGAGANERPRERAP
jgi:hypothetical protein